jgi:hypothetical protein
VAERASAWICDMMLEEAARMKLESKVEFVGSVVILKAATSAVEECHTRLEPGVTWIEMQSTTLWKEMKR